MLTWQMSVHKKMVQMPKAKYVEDAVYAQVPFFPLTYTEALLDFSTRLYSDQTVSSVREAYPLHSGV